MYPRLLGDIGGTHARFGWQAGPGDAPELIDRLRGDAFAGVAQAAQAYLDIHALPPAQAACLGMATPMGGDQVTLTNRGWSFSIQRLKEQLGVKHLLVINDFTALALAVPGLQSHEKILLGGDTDLPSNRTAAQPEPIAVLGPGTGLGVSGLLPMANSRWKALAGEGGHVTLAAQDELQWRLLRRIAQRHGHVSAERVLSGPGLGLLHLALRQERGEALAAEAWSAARIVEQARTADPSCIEAVELFCAFLGAVAGDLALTLGARGGVYLGGGVAPHLLPWLRAPAFRASFEAKGRFASYLREISIWLIDSRQSPALRGAALALEDALT